MYIKQIYRMLCNILLTALKKIIAALVVGRTLQDTVLWSWVWKGEGCIQISIFLYRCSESKQLRGLQFFVWEGARVYSVSGLENTIWGRRGYKNKYRFGGVFDKFNFRMWLSANFSLFFAQHRILLWKHFFEKYATPVDPTHE